MTAGYDIVAESDESTVVAEYTPERIKRKEYQSEADLEKDFIDLLQQQAYERLPIHSEAELISNLRSQLEKLNDCKFTDDEWRRFFECHLANKNEGILEKTRSIQEDYVKNLTKDNGRTENIRLIDKKDIHNNSLQVINQYSTSEGSRDNRYDVTILVNGLPLVHVELKRRGVDIKEAFNQINRYQRESFWAGSGLFEFVQIFVISNGTFTKYYSNTTRFRHIKETFGKSPSRSAKKTSDSYEFTSWWADSTNKPITDLMDFGRTFFAKHSILSLLTKYCVFTTENVLMVMRPYQIAATERILDRINASNNYKTYGTVKGGGYIWHTTGSGKTLTSFKTAQIAASLPYIYKVLFVVDRKDLDYQTMKEYDKFAKGCANGNTNTSILTKQLESDNGVSIKISNGNFITSQPIVITTIQKLAVYIKKHKNSPAFNKRIVIIFDECHRSQFGDMHTAVTKSFKKYHLFGFTGTPIFSVNAAASGKFNLRTTEQAFGEKLHTYTIVDAITDKNVLPFRIDYVSTLKEEESILDEKVRDIDREKALMSGERISNVVKYILEHFDQKTKRNSFYQLKDRRVGGFNSIFATASIPACKLYYEEFKRQMEGLVPDKRLKFAAIFSYAPNEEEPDSIPTEEDSQSADGLDKSSREFLESAISDYNSMFKTSFDTSSEGFQNYYKDVSERVKNRELDLLIVVNMFLTGFDATTMNTLWVDKNLRLHGLLQAFSRTNRILNSIKSFGNIVCFRNLEKATNESIALFGDKEAGGVVLLRPYSDYYNGWESDSGKKQAGYVELVGELESEFPAGGLISGDEAKKDFIRLYGAVLRMTNVLSSFDEFSGNEILSERDVQDYHSAYIDIYNELHPKSGVGQNVNNDLVFEMELIKQVEMNIDYILSLIRKYHDGHLKDKEIVVSIDKAVNSSIELRNKKDLIDKFVESLTPSSDVDDDWRSFVKDQKDSELQRIISEENLDKNETEKFVADAFRDGRITETGTAITKLLPPLDPFAPNKQYIIKKNSVLEKLKVFFERFFGI